MNSFATGQTSKLTDKFIKKFTNNAVKPMHEAVLGNALIPGALLPDALLGWAILRKGNLTKHYYLTQQCSKRATHKMAYISSPKPSGIGNI